MALKDPRTVPGIECILRSVDPINDVIDDIEWWRSTLQADDGVAEVVARLPIADDEKECLLADLRAFGPHGEATILAAIRFAMDRFDAIDIDWDVHKPQNIIIGSREGDDGRVLTMCLHLG